MPNGTEFASAPGYPPGGRSCRLATFGWPSFLTERNGIVGNSVYHVSSSRLAVLDFHEPSQFKHCIYL